MNTNERIKKISRKYLIIILLLCAIIVTGTLYALFSDTSSIDVNSTSGSLHLNKNGETKTRYYIAGSTEQSTPYTETVSNLKPNDIIRRKRVNPMIKPLIRIAKCPSNLSFIKHPAKTIKTQSLALILID